MANTKAFMVHVAIIGGDELRDSAIADALTAQLPEQVNVFPDPRGTEPVEVGVRVTGWTRAF